MSEESKNVKQLRSASKGFDYLFLNNLKGAKDVFADDDSPFHQLGLGAVVFLEAALGMEVHDALYHTAHA